MNGEPRILEPIHLLEDGRSDPAWNMAVDDALLHLRQSGAIDGTWVRLFGWAPPAVSIGRLQSPSAELDLAALERAGVPVVRRSTGGKAVYHANELTYSLVGAVPDATWGENLHETYRRVTAVIADALARLGVVTSLAPRRGKREATGAVAGRVAGPVSAGEDAAGDLSAACFAVAFGHELVFRGRKICGSAQRRLTRAFLQHGSLLLGQEQARLAHFLRVAGDRERLAERLRADTIDVATAAGRATEWEEVAGAVVSALEASFGRRVAPAALPSEVEAEARERLSSVRVDGG
jgi:lipoate-protein ligase A